MQTFLTSHFCFYEDPHIDPANGLLIALKRALPASVSLLFVANDPENRDSTVYYGEETRGGLRNAGFAVRDFAVLDSATEQNAAALIAAADLIVLAGGDVPTQNRFFRRIGLKALLRGYDGVVAGISAGTMNSADSVFCPPEGRQIADAPDLSEGLGLTKLHILPHYQDYKADAELHARVLLPASRFCDLFAVPDGTYLHFDGTDEWLCGEAYRLSGGIVTQVQKNGERRRVRDGRLQKDAEPIGE